MIFEYLEYSYENKKIVYYLDEVERTMGNINFSYKQKYKLMTLLCFTRHNLHLDDEIISILKILKKIDYRFDHYSSGIFYGRYLNSRAKLFYNYKKVFSQLSNAGFELTRIMNLNNKFINKMILDAYSMEELNQLLGFTIDFKDYHQRVPFLSALSQMNQDSSNLEYWVDQFVKGFSSDIDHHGPELIFLLKLSSNTKNENLKQFLLSQIPNKSIIHDLVVNGYNFDQINSSFKELIIEMKFIPDVKSLLQLTVGKSNKHLIRVFSSVIFKNKSINFSILKIMPLLRNQDVNFIYSLLEDERFHNLPSYSIEEKDFPIIHHIFNQISFSKKKQFLLDLYTNFYIFREIKANYESILSKDPSFKVGIQYKSIQSFAEYLSLEHENHYFNNSSLGQINNFPILSKIDGFKIDDLFFEIPKTKYDLYKYGMKMSNCIASYSNRCEFKSSILIGIYKSSKLEYNVELGIDFVESYNSLESVYNEEISPFGLFSKRNHKPRKIIQMEKKYKTQIPIDDKQKIIKVLSDFNLID